MKVSVYHLPDGSTDIMVEASPGNGKAPVVLKGVTRENLRQQVGALVAAQRGRRAPVPGPARP